MSNVETESELLNRYWQEAKSVVDQLVEATAQQEKPIRKDFDRRLAIYGKQLNSFKSQFPEDIRGAINEACFYELQALSLMGTSSGFRRAPGRGKSLAVTLATNAIASAQEKKNAQQALSLLDKAIATFEQPNSRYLKATIFNIIGQKANAINELNYIIANFPEDPLYMEARSLKDEIENPPKKGMCFVATAAYGSALEPQVVFLSRFRDDVLLSSGIGRFLVRTYYWVSPPLAAHIERNGALRRLVRWLLAPILIGLKASKFGRRFDS